MGIEFFAGLDDPSLVLSDAYIGPDRRASGFRARVLRGTFSQRRQLLRLELMVATAVCLVGLASLLWAGTGEHLASNGTAAQSGTAGSVRPQVEARAAVPAVAPTPASVPVVTTTTVAPVVSTAALTPEQMGALALTMVRYPWQSIPGYAIKFLPISDAPSSGFYGNTTFTWGQAGGESDLYVYPGETVERLAAITAFEIGHEVDAAAVEPQGGHTQIENVLGLHPASWSPNCDCAEQGFLSGWYAAAFSNYWSPGVGNWSQILPEPSGAVLSAVEPWLNPSIS